MSEYASVGSETARIDYLRAQFLASTTPSIYAAAVQPVAATTIHTDETGIFAGDIGIPTSDGTIPGYSARPDKPGKFPLVVVIQEIFGVHEHIKDVCRRFAKRGYAAVSPELYARQGDTTTLTDFTEIRAIVAKVPDAQVMSDLDAAVEWAVKEGGANGEWLGVTGFCWGGTISWLYTAHSPHVAAAVAWYGKLVGETTIMRPKQPVDVAADLHSPVLGLYGAQDTSIPLDSIEQMRTALSNAGKPSEIIVYPDSGHAFHADYRPSYNAADSADGEARMYAWFKANGGL